MDHPYALCVVSMRKAQTNCSFFVPLLGKYGIYGGISRID